MLFNSLEYFAFLGVVLALYWALSHRAQNRLLLVASYVFYGWWDVRFLYLILLSTVIDYACAHLMQGGGMSRRQGRSLVGLATGAAVACVVLEWRAVSWHVAFPWVTIDAGFWNPRAEVWVLPVVTLVLGALAPRLCGWVAARLDDRHRRRLYLAISVAANLGILGVFKYCNFFLENLTAGLGALGFDSSGWHLDLVLPVGISFYTFQTLSYTIDVYRGTLQPTTRFADFALFVAFFPQLVAGPIERASKLLPRLCTPRRLDLDQLTGGLGWIVLGLFKKVAIADGLARTVDAVYGASAGVTGPEVALATVCFAFQIYCDFSGYSDIARGSARLLGIELQVNFDLPYFSRSPAEFWRRWHISLSGWLRDYLYIPLGGNRHGAWRTTRNLLVTMLLGGLWHGAAWNFVLWGLYQGLLLCAQRGLARVVPVRARPASPAVQLMGAGLALGGCFLLTCYGWLLFRAESLAQVIDFTRLLLLDRSALGPGTLPGLPVLAGLALLFVHEARTYLTGQSRFLLGLPVPLRGAGYAALIFLIGIGLCGESSQFIYFQF